MTIYDEVLSFIEAPKQACFEALALQVFRHQFDTVSPYREYCQSRGVNPNRIDSIDRIPPLSTVAFKYADLTDSVTPLPAAGGRTFSTSGTTAGPDERGRHRVPCVDIYRASAVGHLRRMLFADGARMLVLSLHPTADRMPESSLGQMISWAMEEFGLGQGRCVADRKGVDTVAAIDVLRGAQRDRAPVCVMTTTAALAALFDALRTAHARLALPAGSRLMDTGGAKGQRLPLGADEVVERSVALLGLEPSCVINEYGMTEMCSQLYDATPFNSRRADDPARRRKLGPPWLDAAAVDPISLERVPDGNPGLLRFFDLANVGSISAILTGDLGVVENGLVQVIGRAADGEARGCALGIEQFAAKDR
ncbi:MAG TPA: hypothetical protein VKT27_00240 [Candidatus Binataceae bacterium]|nr:hypothetical protein [Candidatus Binataceae bacterium]